jgi:predicted NAD/FAD-dependent oxidoreductase
MAIGTPQSLGTAPMSSGASTSIVLTTSAAAPSGSRIIVTVVGNTDTTCTVTDSASNSYTEDKRQYNASNTSFTSIFSAHAASGLGSGGTITATFGASVNRQGIAAMSVTGLATSSYTNGTNGRNQFGPTWTSNQVTTTEADVLLAGASQETGTQETDTPAVNLTELHEWNYGFAHSATTVYRILSATGTYEAGGTWTGGANDVTSAIVMYKAAPSGPTAPYVSVSVA